MNKKLLGFVSLVLLAFFTSAFVYSSRLKGKNSKLNQSGYKTAKVYFESLRPLYVELAENSNQQALGLSNRTSLESNSGMLFVFSSPRILTFWMKDMHFPIDIIWIRDLTVVDISPNLEPSKEETFLYDLPVYSPKEIADMALEVNASWSIQNKITIGEKLRVENE